VRLSREELKRLLAPLVIALAALGAGAALLWSTGQTLAAARGTIAAAAAQYKQSTERLARIAEEEREVRQKLDVYQRLKQLHIVGEENRLEWGAA
jgi:hypothetical protein